MKDKKKSTGAANSDAFRQLNHFLSSFHSKRTDIKVQCLNCDAKIFPGNSTATAMYDKAVNTVYVFRICRECRRSFLRMTDDLKKEMCENLKNKAKKAEANQ